MLLELWVEGDPAPQPRPRIAAIRGGRSRVFTPRTAEGWKQRLALAAQQAWGKEPLREALEVDLQFFIARPRSHFTSKGALRKGAPRHHVSKPDRDNLEKSTLDALTGVLWADDALLIGGHVRKRYAVGGPGVLIVVRRAE